VTIDLAESERLFADIAPPPFNIGADRAALAEDRPCSMICVRHFCDKSLSRATIATGSFRDRKGIHRALQATCIWLLYRQVFPEKATERVSLFWQL